MDVTWWVAGFVCFGVVTAAIVLFAVLVFKEQRNRKRTLAVGDPTIGWIVQANRDLFEDGQLDLPALVLISPDPQVADDEEFMTELAARIQALKGQDCDDEDEELVSEWVTDERYREGRRDRVPNSLTDGKKVYLAHIYIVRDDLPQKKLDRDYVRCSVIWDEPRTLICSRPHKKKFNEADE